MTDYFRVSIPGQPPSWNHAYEHATRFVGGRRVARMFKTEEAKAFQAGVILAVQAARPTDFRPTGQVVVGYEMFLTRSLDADNVMKMVNDSVARAMGINDNRFLPVTLRKESPSDNPMLVIHVADAATWRPVIERL